MTDSDTVSAILDVAAREVRTPAEVELVQATRQLLQVVRRLERRVERLRTVAIAADLHLSEGTPITRSRLSAALEAAGHDDRA